MHYGGTEWVLSIESMLIGFKSTSAALISLTQTPQLNLSSSQTLIIFHLWPTTELQFKTQSKLHLIESASKV